VGDEVPGVSSPEAAPPGDGRLDSWKEIAGYLRRDVTTVRRWEKREGLPVHRHLHDRRDSVYAYRHEVDRWWLGRRNHLAANGVTAEQHGKGGSRVWWLVGMLAMATLTSFTVLVALFPRTSADDRQWRFPMLPPDGASIGTLRLSPDGRQMAFTTTTPHGAALLWVRPADSLTPIALSGTEGAAFPFWSPDGRSIGFFASGRLKTINVGSGSSRILCEAPGGRGGTWNASGTIVFSPSRESALVQVSASGGTPTEVTALDPAGERGHLWPQFLPDGRHFLYLADSARPDFHNLFVGSLDSMERTRIFTLASDAEYTRDGYLVFIRDRALLAQPFNARRLELSGDPITLAPQVVQQWAMDHKGDFSVSDQGTLVYRSMSASETRLVWRDRDGREAPVINTPADYYEPTLSPNQRHAAVDVFDPRQSRPQGYGTVAVTSDIWILDATSGTTSQFTFDPAADFAPLWSPDGTRIVFSSNRRGVLDLYQKRVDGAGTEEPLFESPISKHAQAWSPDGRFVLFGTYDARTREDVWMLPLDGERTPVELLHTEFNEEQASISPDGRWLAYTSDEPGTPEVYVQSFPPGRGKWRISTGGGGDARWRPDGQELFYIADDRLLMAVPVKIGMTFEHGQAAPLFDTGMTPRWGEARNHYDVSRDGLRFLAMVPVADDRSAPFTIVVNWTAGLRK
jgi:Tol biopolymer transport system component